MAIVGNRLKTSSGGVVVIPTPADVLKGLFRDLAPAFTYAVIEARKKHERIGRGSIERPMDILLEIVRDKVRNGGTAKHQSAIAKRATRKRVAV